MWNFTASGDPVQYYWTPAHGDGKRHRSLAFSSRLKLFESRELQKLPATVTSHDYWHDPSTEDFSVTSDAVEGTGFYLQATYAQNFKLPDSWVTGLDIGAGIFIDLTCAINTTFPLKPGIINFEFDAITALDNAQAQLSSVIGDGQYTRVVIMHVFGYLKNHTGPEGYVKCTVGFQDRPPLGAAANLVTTMALAAISSKVVIRAASITPAAARVSSIPSSDPSDWVRV